MERVLVIAFSDLASDPRVNRHIRLLSERYRVTAAGFASPNIENVEFISCPVQPLKRSSLKTKLDAVLRLKARRFEAYYWGRDRIKHCVKVLADGGWDLVVANDIDALPLATQVAKGAGVIFDAHEYAPREYEDQWKWRFLFKSYNAHLCQRYIPLTDQMITVCEGIAQEYTKDYGVKPTVITNAPPYSDLTPCCQNGQHVRMVHHGAAIPSRRTELMIDTMRYLDDRFSLDLILVPGDESYIETLRQRGKSNPRIRFLPRIPMQELVAFTNAYDIGLFLLPPTNFNYKWALPNKFFEFIQARLAVGIGPSPEMARLVRQYDCGLVAKDFTAEALAEVLNKLDRDQLQYYKQQSNKAAQEACFEKNAQVLLEIVGRVFKTKRRAA